MEFRVLQYFLAVAREQTISGAAQSLHLTQPTLSRQLKDLEDELGKQLMIRSSRKITLTEEGILLRKRAEEIVELVNKTENEISLPDDSVSGDICIGTGETEGIRLIAKAAQDLRNEHPQVHFHITSGDAGDIAERLDKGLFDFGILLGQLDMSKYDYLKIPATDRWGVLMRRDSPLAKKDCICPEDLWDKPLLFSRQAAAKSELTGWIGKGLDELDIAATYNLVYNASLMVAEGMGYAVTLDKLINTSGSSLCFKPLYPCIEIGMNIVWKKYQVFSKASERFLQRLRQQLITF